MSLVQQVKNGVLVDSTGQAISTTSGSDSTDEVSNDLGYDQFLQILCAEMQYQDPLEPTSNTEYIAQLATFSQLESTLSMQDTVEQSSANDLVGKYVIMKVTSDSTGETSYVEGTCDYVLHQDGTTYLSINDSLYSLDDLYSVEDSDYVTATTIADTLKTAIEKLPSKNQLTTAYQEDVENIRTVYDSLTTYQKSVVDADTWKTFEELETRMKELVAAKEASESEASANDTTDSTTTE